MNIYDGQFFPLFVGVALILMALVGYRLTCAAQPLRLKLAQNSEELISNPALPELMRNHVKVLADTAFGMRLHLLLGIFLIPIIAIIFVVRHRLLREGILSMRTNDPVLQKEFDQVCRLHRALMLANHPLLFPIVELEMVLFMSPAILLRAIIRGMLSDSDEREILSFLEDKRVSFLTLQRVAANTR